MNTRNILGGFIGLTMLIVLVVATRFFYPIPRRFWTFYHRNDFITIENLSEKLMVQEVYYKGLKCWDIGSRCGIQLVFSTPMSLGDMTTFINKLGYEQKLSRSIDGKGIYTVLDIDAGKEIELNGKIFDPIKDFEDAKEPDSWGWWLVSPSGNHYNLDIFTWSTNGDHLLIGRNELEDNVVSLILYTKGR